jgi:hypothetical protein
MSTSITLLSLTHAWESDRLSIVVLYWFVTTGSDDFHYHIMSVYYLTFFYESYE